LVWAMAHFLACRENRLIAMAAVSSIDNGSQLAVRPARELLSLFPKSALDRRCRFRLGHFCPFAYVVARSQLACQEGADWVPRQNPRFSRDKSLFLIGLGCCRDCRVNPGL
jgi:hypothetical protein